MAISESQLTTWSGQGSVTQSKSTYGSIRTALERSEAPYSARSTSIFLQGSYCNDTNIYADSDVDVVMMLEGIHYTDLSQLSAEDRAAYDAARSPGSYSFNDFKAEVGRQLVKCFGPTVDASGKAIFVPGNSSRRDCDVLACVELRRYMRFKSHFDCRYDTGVCFWNREGLKIMNYPKQHSASCTSKHQATNQWFKPTVRIVKNIRKRMIDAGYLREGVAPSYFLEGMLWNVPADKFGGSYEGTIVNSINWLINCDRSKLMCANNIYYLCHPSSLVTWRAEQLQAFLDAFARFWREWGG